MEPLVEDKSRYPWWVLLVLSIIQCWLYVYDLLAFIPFQLFANPQQKLERSRRKKAKPLEDGNPGSPWRNLDCKDGKLQSTLFAETQTLSTLDKVLDRSAWLYANCPLLGTRQILSVEKVEQNDGRKFEKYDMGEYQWETHAEVYERVMNLGSGLVSVGHSAGERVVIFAETRAEWLLTALTCFKFGCPVVTVYATLGEDAIAHAISETEATTIVTSEDLVPKIVDILPRCEQLRRMIYFERRVPNGQSLNPRLLSLPDLANFRVMSFKELEETGKIDKNEPEVEPRAEDIAVIMYTSGTTGLPKGVLISHRNLIAANAAQAHAVPEIGYGDVYIGYLPLAHVLELCAELVCFSHGVCIGYSSALTLTDTSSKIKKGSKGDCSVLQPTLLAAVPAIMDRIYKTVITKVSGSSPMWQALFFFLYERKRTKIEHGYDNPFLNRTVFARLRSILGGRVRIILSGGAPLNPETERFMNICFCCPVGQGYGLTETCSAGSIADSEDLSVGRVGPPLICNDILLRNWEEAGYRTDNKPNPQGEILIGGDNLAEGYLKNPEKTAEDFITLDGRRWFCTGDIGEIQEDGCLLIIDRKKEMVKLSQGEYISLARVETVLLTCPLVDCVCVYGNSFHSFLVALLVPNRKLLEDIAQKLELGHLSFEEKCDQKEIKDAILKELKQHAAKSKLGKFEIPEKIHICSEVWTPSMGLLTEAMKLKRKPIENKYKNEIQQMYS